MVTLTHTAPDSCFTAVPSSDGKLRLLDSSQLFNRGSNEVLIQHQGEMYRLRLTRNGKLILTK